MFTTVMVFTSPTITSRYFCSLLPTFTFSFICNQTNFCFCFCLSAYSRVINLPLPAVFWPKLECSVGLGWRWADRLGSGSTGQCCDAQVGRGRIGKGGKGIARILFLFHSYKHWKIKKPENTLNASPCFHIEDAICVIFPGIWISNI